MKAKVKKFMDNLQSFGANEKKYSPKRIVSNSSALISFCRTGKFYPLLKILFAHVIVPKDFPNEMITNTWEDYKFADRRRIIGNKDSFPKIIEHTGEERKICKGLINIAYPIILIFNISTKKSHAVPVEKYRAFPPSLIKNLLRCL
ncbi:MAG: hypothetical protein CVT88_08845 [Candidatus Altiarchaeales archaeon HGW-Altiarchaeales-1]|nr:MAG: hypothetical protein CVT88_08845 [Candidatus Altiarchaeales archaeon HGW-Altiarchaeales-1]